MKIRLYEFYIRETSVTVEDVGCVRGMCASVELQKIISSFVGRLLPAILCQCFCRGCGHGGGRRGLLKKMFQFEIEMIVDEVSE